jgi:hypothetical protein
MRVPGALYRHWQSCEKYLAELIRVMEARLFQIVREVDRSLIRWSLARAPLERLRSATRSLRGLRRFR